MSNDARRPGAVTLTTIVLAAATLYASKPSQLARSFEAHPREWADPDDPRFCTGSRHRSFEEPTGWPGPPSCVGRDDDDACFRELYRAQLEAYEANRSYDEIAAVSPTGVAFVKPTRVR